MLSARVHPGESNASWIMKGVINFLISDHDKAQQLRNKFVFKVSLKLFMCLSVCLSF